MNKERLTLAQKKHNVLQVIQGTVESLGETSPFMTDNEFCAPRARNFPAHRESLTQRRWRGMTYAQVKSGIDGLVADGILDYYGQPRYRRYVFQTVEMRAKRVTDRNNAERNATLTRMLQEALTDAGISSNDNYGDSAVIVNSRQLADLLADANLIPAITPFDITDRIDGN